MGSTIRIVVMLAIVVAATWWTVHSVDLTKTVQYLYASNVWYIAACIPIILLSHLFRAHRWCVLLQPSYPQIRLLRSYSAVLIGYAVNTLIPRAGELARPWVLARREGIPLGASISSVVVERALDVLTLLVGIVIVFVVASDRITLAIPTFSYGKVLSMIVLPVLGITAFIIIMVFTSMGRRVIDATVRRVSAVFAAKLHDVLATVRDGMQALTAPALYARIAVDTVFIWFLWIVPIWLTYHAIGFSPDVAFDLADAAVLLLIISVGVTIAPTPGALGVYQSFAQSALVVLYAAELDKAFAFGMLAWALNYIVVFVAGAIAWMVEMRQGITWSDLRRSSRMP